MYKDTLAPVGKAVSPFVYSSVFVVYEFIVNSSLYVVYLDECNCWQILSRFLSLALYLCMYLCVCMCTCSACLNLWVNAILKLQFWLVRK